MTTILVVEDEPKIAQFARDYLEHAGFRVVTAGDGRFALKAVARERPELIVLDLRLPDMDGLDVARALRKDSTVPDSHLSAVLEETRVLSTLIEDLRTLALAETGALSLHREGVDLGVLIHDVVTAFRPKAEAAGVLVTTECRATAPPVEIDPVRIRQVVANLLANALQHTPAGGSIRIACELNLEGTRPREVSVSVADSGTGIAPEDLPHVFARFYKSRDSRGSGLGLAIARQLVAAHGGQIAAHSEVGKGTTIRLTLPLERPD